MQFFVSKIVVRVLFSSSFFFKSLLGSFFVVMTIKGKSSACLKHAENYFDT